MSPCSVSPATTGSTARSSPPLATLVARLGGVLRGLAGLLGRPRRRIAGGQSGTGRGHRDRVLDAAGALRNRPEELAGLGLRLAARAHRQRLGRRGIALGTGLRPGERGARWRGCGSGPALGRLADGQRRSRSGGRLRRWALGDGLDDGGGGNRLRGRGGRGDRCGSGRGGFRHGGGGHPRVRVGRGCDGWSRRSHRTGAARLPPAPPDPPAHRWPRAEPRQRVSPAAAARRPRRAAAWAAGGCPETRPAASEPSAARRAGRACAAAPRAPRRAAAPARRSAPVPRPPHHAGRRAPGCGSPRPRPRPPAGWTACGR